MCERLPAQEVSVVPWDGCNGLNNIHGDATLLTTNTHYSLSAIGKIFTHLHGLSVIAELV